MQNVYDLHSLLTLYIYKIYACVGEKKDLYQIDPHGTPWSLSKHILTRFRYFKGLKNAQKANTKHCFPYLRQCRGPGGETRATPAPLTALS